MSARAGAVSSPSLSSQQRRGGVTGRAAASRRLLRGQESGLRLLRRCSASHPGRARAAFCATAALVDDSGAEEDVDLEEACIPVSSQLSERGLALQSCLLETPDKFCGRVQQELEGIGLLEGDRDLPLSELRELQLALAQDIMYLWMLAETYCSSEELQRGMRELLRLAEGESLAEGDRRWRQLTATRLMLGMKGMYRVGSVRFSSDLGDPSKKKWSELDDASRGGLVGDTSDSWPPNPKSPASVAFRTWSENLKRAMAIGRGELRRSFSMWARSGYMDRRLDRRAKLDSMVTGRETKKSSYFDHVMKDLLKKQEGAQRGAPPAALTNELLQFRTLQAVKALKLHTGEMLELDSNRPADEFTESILADFGAMGQLMEESSRCGRSLYDAESLVLQYVELQDWEPGTPGQDYM